MELTPTHTTRGTPLQERTDRIVSRLSPNTRQIIDFMVYIEDDATRKTQFLIFWEIRSQT